MLEIAEYTPIRAAEPPVILIDSTDATLWRCPDGALILRIGLTGDIGADTIEIPPHLARPVRDMLTEALR